MTTKTDILIIGGGVVGLSCAYYLLKTGRQVTLLEQKTVGSGSSMGNAGQIVPSHIVPLAAPGVIGSALKWMLDPQNSPFGLKISLDPAYLAWLARFAASCTAANVEKAIPALGALGRLSAESFAALIAEEKFDCHYRPSGLLYLYKTPAAFDSGQREAELLNRHGIAAEVLDRAAVHEREPAALAEVIGGMHLTGDAALDPARFVQALAQRVRELGADIREQTPVTVLESADQKITRVRTPQGDFEPDLVVLAAGAWSPQVGRGLGLNIPVQPGRGYNLTVSSPQNGPRLPLILDERRVAVSPMGGLLRFTGRLEIGEMSTTTPNPRWIRAIERAAREYIQLDEKLDIRETWAGLRPTTPDGLPIIGFSPRHANLILATGHAMLGVTLAPGTGQVVAQLANGARPVFEIRPFAVERFR